MESWTRRGSRGYRRLVIFVSSGQRILLSFLHVSIQPGVFACLGHRSYACVALRGVIGEGIVSVLSVVYQPGS